MGPPHPESAPYQVLGAMGLVNVEIKRSWFVMWSRGRCVTWLCRWDAIILSHYPAKFGTHRPWESGNITFLICNVTAISKCHVTLKVGSLILNCHRAKIGVHRPYGTGNNGICNISSNSSSNSNSNAEVPVPRFTNGHQNLNSQTARTSSHNS